MAEKEKSKKHHKKVPHKIITTRAEDGSFGHEHIHHGSDRSVFAGTSQNLDDLKQHMQDHFGGGGGAQEEQAEGEPATAAPGENEAAGE